MNANDKPFTRIVNGTMQFVIPVFQRDYRWSEIQCQQLWDDIVAVAERPSKRGHFLGSVVYVPTEDTSVSCTRWLLIDGQQRVTTLTLLFTALRDHIEEQEWVGNEDGPTPERIEAYFLKNLQESGERRYKLLLRRHDQETLRAIIDRGTTPADESKRIRDAYSFFRDRLAEGELDPEAVYQAIAKLIVVDVTLDRQNDDPQMVFESLNSTGVDLSQSDLIRNFVLMRLPEAEQTRLYRDHWQLIEQLFRGSEKTFDTFARDYLALRTSATKQEKADQIYRAFRRSFEPLKEKLGGLEGLLADMYRHARYYAAFVLDSREWPDLAQHLRHLRRLVDVPAVLLMRLFDCYDRVGSLSEAEFVESLRLLESYVLRRAVGGLQTRGYWQVFATTAQRVTDGSPFEDLRVRLALQRETYRFPSRDDFERDLTERDLYGLRVCKHLLDRLENAGSNEPVDTSDYTIEHILPQNDRLITPWKQMLGDDWEAVQEKWLHRLGNLTLTGYNSTYSDRSFDEKKTVEGGFADSSIRLNRWVREQEVWTTSEIAERGRMLARKALNVWPDLVVDEAAVNAARDKDKQELAARRDADQVPMSEKARCLFECLSEKIHRMSPDIIEIAEPKSVSYHGPAFFLEVLPRKHRLVLLLAIDFNEVDDPEGIAEDTAERTFFVNAKYEGGVSVRFDDEADRDNVLPLVRQAYALAAE